VAAPTPVLHLVQLSGVFLERISTRLVAGERLDSPTVAIPRVALRSASEDRSAFDCSARAVVRMPTSEGVWRADVSVRGSFVTEPGTVSKAQLRYFVATSALYLLWPYARVYVTQVALLAGVSGPPLPLIVRPSAGQGTRA
jgi:hypothetical protein